MEINQKNNVNLKKNFANKAIELLLNQNLLTKDKLGPESTICSYGYIFTLENDDIEGLFKITCCKETFYFAIQKKQLMLLKINESLYKSLVANAIDLHDCLK